MALLRSVSLFSKPVLNYHGGMKIISWNVNGLRAILKKGFADAFETLDADLFFIGESKLSDESAVFPFEPQGYHVYHSVSKVKKGYSGVVLWSKEEPLSVQYGLKNGLYSEEGRVIFAEYPSFYFLGAYVPNSGEELKRLPFRLEYEERLRAFMEAASKKKPIIYAGDLNVAHNEIDIKNPAANRHNAGFTDEERNAFTLLLSKGFVDSFRYLYPDTVTYSWWSYRFHARERNAGWRIDYFVLSESLLSKLKDSKIHTEILGSDHAPIELDIDL